MRRRRFLGAVLLVATAALGGCSAPKPKADLEYRVNATDGGIASQDQVRRVENELDTRLLEAGYERRNVKSLGADRVRISLPESVASKIPEIRKMLEGGDFWAEIKVKLTLVSGGGGG